MAKVQTMKAYLSGLLLFLMLHHSFAALCPDPNQSSLAWGEAPSPWLVNPFSKNTPQGEKNTSFIAASILIAGIGRGVMCTYQNSLGHYSIWWPVALRSPLISDVNWRASLGGYACTNERSQCVFYPAADPLITVAR